MLYATMMDIWYYTYVQTPKKYKTKSEPYCKLWTLDDHDMSM